MINKVVKTQIAPIFILLTLLSLSLPVYAQPPEIPQEFRGNIIVNGTPPPQGTTILVRIGSTQIAATTTDAQGRYGYASPLLVSTTNGSLLEFFVNGIKAKETATSKSGEITTLNLTVSSSSPPPQQQPSATPPSTSSSAANFIVSNLNISQSSVKPGEPVTVTADVKNSGDSEGTYKVLLQVNNTTEIEQTVTLSPGRTQKLTYAISKDKVGKYTVAVDSQSNSFSVNPPEVSWISAITNQPWWLYTIVGIGVLLVLLVVILVISRRNSSYF
jgi:hypothetical protein